MSIKHLSAIILTGVLTTAAVNTLAAEPSAAREDIQLSPAVLSLLKAEMVEIAGGMQGVPLALASADWKSIHVTSKHIRASYIMEKKLTEAQAKELESALPAYFKQLDAEFHQRAAKLGAAAAAHDPEQVAYQYSRLLESCTLCHTSYAKTRFPGFSAPAAPGHAH